MKYFRRNQKGIAHDLLLPLFVMAIVGAMGVYLLSKSDAGSVAGSYNIATYNVRFDTPSSKMVSDIKYLVTKEKVDILTLQETPWDAKYQAIRKKFACKSCEFDMYAPRQTKGHAETIIMWRKSLFSLTLANSIQTTKEIPVGHTTMRALHVNYVRLKPVAGDTRLVVLTNHLPAHIEYKGKPMQTKIDYQTRIELYRKNMSAIVEKIKRTESGVPVVVTGDFNVDYRYDKIIRYNDFPYNSLRLKEARSNWEYTNYDAKEKGGTITGSKRLIDYVFLSKNGGYGRINSTKIVRKGMHSDHRPVVANVSILDEKAAMARKSNPPKAFPGDAPDPYDTISEADMNVTPPTNPLSDML